MSTGTERITIDMDTGGTFTDGSVNAGGEVLALKVLTTPHDLSICFRDLIDTAARRLGLESRELLTRTEAIRYSTTIGTNTILQRNGPRLGVIVRDRDVATLATFAPDTLVGTILDPLEDRVRGVELDGGDGDRERVLRAVEELLEASAERLVVAISGDDGAEERRIERIILEEYPRHILGALPVLFSSEMTEDPDIGRRTVTAVFNAYLHPDLEQFLYEAEDILRAEGYARPLFVFGNDGTSNRVAKVTALKTYSSGPAGGLEGAAALAGHYEFSRVATIDVGGTSTDLGFLADGEIETDARGVIAGAELSLPMRRIEALGGGGGTIATVVDGVLKLGPESAGSAPGPACFGFGGTAATVTDADLVLGCYGDGARLAGRLALDRDRARQAIEQHVAGPLGCAVEEAAAGISDLLEQRVADAVSAGIAKRGGRPGDWVLMAYGGAGPLHAAGVADRAGIPRVLVPAQASVLSAFGIGFSDVEHRYERRVTPPEAASVAAATAELEHRATIDMRGEGLDPALVELTGRVRLLRGDEELGALNGEDLGSALARHGDADAAAVEMIARGRLRHVTLDAVERPSEPPEPIERRPVRWSVGVDADTAIYAAQDVDGRQPRIAGPAIVAGEIVTIGVPPGWVLTRDRHDQFFLTHEGA